VCYGTARTSRELQYNHQDTQYLCRYEELRHKESDDSNPMMLKHMQQFTLQKSKNTVKCFQCKMRTEQILIMRTVGKGRRYWEKLFCSAQCLSDWSDAHNQHRFETRVVPCKKLAEEARKIEALNNRRKKYMDEHEDGEDQSEGEAEAEGQSDGEGDGDEE
jgi:hypothetical protein